MMANNPDFVDPTQPTGEFGIVKVRMKKADMPIARGQHSASAVNGKIYAIGGWNPAFAPKTLSLVEEYTPEGWPFSVLPSGKLQAKWGEIKSD